MAGRSSTAREIDKLVGARIGERRVMLGLTQQQFAEPLGTSAQQVNKYEHGVNVVSAGRLFEIALALGSSIGFFYEETPRPITRRPHLLQTMRNLAEITDERRLEAVSRLIRALAGRDDGMGPP